MSLLVETLRQELIVVGCRIVKLLTYKELDSLVYTQ